MKHTTLEPKRIAIIGAGLQGVVQSWVSKQYLLKSKLDHEYEVVVVESLGESGYLSTFFSNDNITKLQGLPQYSFGGKEWKELHPSILGDEKSKSKGVLTRPKEYMSESDCSWVNMTDALSQHPYKDSWEKREKDIVSFGNFSVILWHAFFAINPKLAKLCGYQYLDGSIDSSNGVEKMLIRYHYNSHTIKEAYHRFHDHYGLRAKKLDYDQMQDIQHLIDPTNIGEIGKYNKEQLEKETWGMGIEGGSMDAKDLAREIKRQLYPKDVIFSFYLHVNKLDFFRGRVRGLQFKPGNIDSMYVDAVIASTGFNTEFLVNSGVDVPVKPVGKCSLTILIPDGTQCPTIPFEVMDRTLGLVSFTPYVNSLNSKKILTLRVSGGCFFDPTMKRSVETCYAKSTIENLRRVLEEKCPEVARAAKTVSDNPQVVYMGTTPDFMPLLGAVGEYIGGEKVKEATGLFLNMGHGQGSNSCAMGSAVRVMQEFAKQFLGHDNDKIKETFKEIFKDTKGVGPLDRKASAAIEQAVAMLDQLDKMREFDSFSPSRTEAFKQYSKPTVTSPGHYKYTGSRSYSTFSRKPEFVNLTRQHTLYSLFLHNPRMLTVFSYFLTSNPKDRLTSVTGPQRESMQLSQACKLDLPQPVKPTGTPQLAVRFKQPTHFRMSLFMGRSLPVKTVSPAQVIGVLKLLRP